MRDDEREALEAVSFNWAPTPARIWQAPEAHVGGLNDPVYRLIRSAYRQAQTIEDSPLGIVVEGEPGSGKTHLLSWTRQHVQDQGGYFLLAGLTRSKEFWPDIVHTFIQDLTRPAAAGGATQLQQMLHRLGEQAGLDNENLARVTGQIPLTPAALASFEQTLRTLLPSRNRALTAALRAMTMMAAEDDELRYIGEGYLRSRLDDATQDWKRWRLPLQPTDPVETAEQMSQILAVTGPAVLAFDQIDTTFAQSRRAGTDDGVLTPLAEDLGNGLMDVRQILKRTVLLVACLGRSWDLIQQHSVTSVADRFRREQQLGRLPSTEIAQRLVARRLAEAYRTVGFRPDYTTWPIPQEAFTAARGLTPRMLLQRVDWHIRACLRADTILPLTDLSDASEQTQAQPPTTSLPELEAFDERLKELSEQTSVDAALSPDTEDTDMPPLLAAGLQAWIVETGAGEEYTMQLGAGAAPIFHAMLRHFLDPDTDDQEHWSIRAIAKTNSRAVIARIERLKRAAALDPQVAKRAAIILRPASTQWSSGPATTASWQGFEAVGGRIITPSPADLKTFAALGALMKTPSAALTAWLIKRRPAGSTTLMKQIFGTTDEGHNGGAASHDGPDPPQDPHPDIDLNAVPLGIARDGSTISTSVESLRKHVAIFAGSGSGKTVLIRRLIEECALRGVSSIVLDSNNDLARLGDAWPDPPPGWQPCDAELAANYLHHTDVVVWTPRRQAGRPLTLQPLPDLSGALDDPDDFAIGLDIAVAALAPRARLTGNTARTDRSRAILREAFSYFARHGGGTLESFIALLADLPEHVASLDRAADIAGDMAQTLTAARINDPLFAGAGTPLDPGVLLTPAPGRRARISVISLIGLTTEEQRQSFVNQLQMGLMTWIKAHPAAAGRPLSGLLVMDEAQTIAPSGPTTAATESTLALASQARKYGLGLVFATQAPKGLHNRIVGNAATHAYGLIKAPAQVSAVRQLVQGHRAEPIDVTVLPPGRFYISGEAGAFDEVTVPMCLSHHPPSALSAEEVLVRAGH